MGDQILEGIIANVKMAKDFAVLANEATDRSLQSQLKVTLCYVDKHGNMNTLIKHVI